MESLCASRIVNLERRTADGTLPVNCSSGGLDGTLVLLRPVAAKRLLTSPVLKLTKCVMQGI